MSFKGFLLLLAIEVLVLWFLFHVLRIAVR